MKRIFLFSQIIGRNIGYENMFPRGGRRNSQERSMNRIIGKRTMMR
jgi:hypothetical protein